MNAWLLTWEWTGLHGPNEKLVAILSSRRATSFVKDYMELLVLRATSGAREMAHLANRRRLLPAKAEVAVINGVPHGDIVCCGLGPPWLYGRKVSELIVCLEAGVEVICWREPSIYKLSEHRRTPILASEGETRQIRRPRARMLDSCLD
jgi:hypothetical protein